MSDSFLGRTVLFLTTNAASLNRGLAGARTRVAKFEKTSAAAGRKISTNLTLPILAIGAAAAKISLDFESSLSQITGLVGVASDQVNEWRDDILALGPAVGKGPTELADALFFITSAGIRGTAALDTLEIAAKASAAGLGETASVADAATSAMNAYGIANLDAAAAINVLVGTVREGKIEAAAIAGVLGRVIPIASELGVEFHEVGAALAAMTRLGANAEEAATSLTSIFNTLNKSTKESDLALAGVGLSASGLRQQLREGGLLDVMFELQKRFEGNETAMAKVFPNIRALGGVLKLLAEDGEAAKTIFASLASDTDFLGDAFNAAALTGKFQLAQSLSVIKGALIPVGDVIVRTIIPIFKSFATFIANISGAFSKLAPGVQDFILRTTLLAAAAGPVLIALSAIAAGIGFLMSPIVLLVLAVSGLAVAVVSNWDTIVKATSDLFKAMKGWLVDKTAPIFDFLMKKFDDFKKAFAAVIAFFAPVLGKLGIALAPFKKTVIKTFDDTRNSVATTVSGMATGTKDTFKNMTDGIGAIFDLFFRDTKDGFADLGTDLDGTTKKTAAAIKKNMTGAVAFVNESVISMADVLGTITASMESLFAFATIGQQALNDVRANNAETLADVTTNNAEALADIIESNADALADVDITDAEALAAVRERNADALDNIRERNADALANIQERNADALSNVQATNADMLKSIVINVINLLEGIILASAAANTALTFSWVPGSIFGIIAALGALEAAKAGVRAMKFGHGGTITPGGTLTTASGATAQVAEAGRTEGIFPLTRMAGGDLGVAVAGGGGGNMPPINLTVNIAESVVATKETIKKMVVPVIEDMAKKLQTKLALRVRYGRFI